MKTMKTSHLLLFLACVQSAIGLPVHDAPIMEASMTTKAHSEPLRYKDLTDHNRPRIAAMKKPSGTGFFTPKAEAAYEPMAQCPTKVCDCSKDENYYLINCRYKYLNTIPDFEMVNFIYDEINFGAGNTIKELPYAAFKNLKVKEINLENNHIAQVSDGAFLGLQTVLKKLCLQGNTTNPIPYSQLSNLVHLRELKLQYFKDNTIPAHNRFGSLEHLEVLEMKNIQGLTTIDREAFTNKLPLLHSLTFESVPFEYLPIDGLQQLRNLTTLVIQNSAITQVFTKSFTNENFRHLKSLTLANNKIKLIEVDAFENVCDNLEEFNLMDNYLNSVSFLTTKTWKRLYSLNLSYNSKLGSIIGDMAFRNMPNLQHLYLEEINLQSISNQMLTGLKSLTNLKLSYNRILKIEDQAFTSTPKLLDIQLDCQFCNEPNQDEQLILSPKTFTSISTTLRRLNLNESPLKADTFWRSVRSLTELQKVYLQKTNLNVIPENAFDYNRKLQIIDLGDNGITKLADSTFHGLHDTLVEISLLNNNLTTISKCIFKDFSRLENIRLFGNNLHCDCEIKWLHEFIIKKSAENSAFQKTMYKCKTPLRFAGTFLYTISSEDLTCAGSSTDKVCHYVTEPSTKATTPISTNITAAKTTLARTTKPTTPIPTKSPASLTLYVGRATQTSISISWTVYGIQSQIKGFNLEYFSVVDNKKINILLHPDTTAYKITNLESGLFYKMCVRVELFVDDGTVLEDCKTRDTLSQQRSAPYKEDTSNNITIIAVVTAVIVVVLIIAGFCMFMKYKLQKLKEIRMTMAPSGRHCNDPSRDYCDREESSSCVVPNEYTDIQNIKLADQYKVYSTKEMQRQYAVDATNPYRSSSTYSKVKRKKPRKQREEPKEEISDVKDDIDDSVFDEEMKMDLEQRHSAPSRLDANDLLKSGMNRNSRPLPATPNQSGLARKSSSTDPIAKNNHVFITQASVYDGKIPEHPSEKRDEKGEIIYHEIVATDTLPRK